MCKVPDKSGFDSQSTGKGEDRGINPSDRWGNESWAKVQEANRKVRLIDVMHQRGFRPDSNPLRPEWSLHMKCPFHKGGNERTPSFGYNFNSDYFSCRACSRSGQAVEFISFLDKRRKIDVALEILEQYGDDVKSSYYSDNSIKIFEELMSAYSEINKLIKSRKNSPEEMEKIEKLLWWIDSFFDNNHRKIVVEDLEYRLSRFKELTKHGK
jgi:hypothetical protein